MKPGVVQLADRVLKYFVPGVLAVAVASDAAADADASAGADARTT